MSFRRWKLGLAIACATGFFTGIIGLSLGLTWKAALILLGASVGKDFMLWVQNHPVEQISFDSTPPIPLPDGSNTKPKP